MLEPDEVEDDYFTPISGTPLANIFDNSTLSKEQNDSLKYTPPKKQPPQAAEVKPEEDTKLSECLFACALTAYEWSQNNYLPRGKVGFAILKITKTNSHSIVLYNSSKITLSTVIITENITVTVKGSNYISYYDNFSKYWSIYAKEDEINKIVELLKTLGVNILYDVNGDQNPPEPASSQTIKESNILYKSDKESDTDSSAYKKTKASILNRMASMGHSVLPSHSLLAQKSTNSSDTSETEEQAPKTLKHKTAKPNMKRTNIEKNTPDIVDTSNKVVQKIEQTLPHSSIYTMVNGQLVPVSNSNIITGYGTNNSNELSLFMTEQRMSNNELRININRTTDKVDQILEKINNLDFLEKQKSNSNIQTDIMQKLLTEYENKIKMYEEILTSKKIVSGISNFPNLTASLTGSKEIDSYRKQIEELQLSLKEKGEEVTKCKELIEENNKQTEEISNLKHKLELKSREIENFSEENQNSLGQEVENKDFESKLKYIMNDVFQSVAINFDDNATYSGESIKNVVGRIIKKLTIQSLSEYKQ